MKIKHLTPTLYTESLHEMDRGQVFRFDNGSKTNVTPYMRLTLDGEDIYNMSEDDFVDMIEVFTEHLYPWSESIDCLDTDYYDNSIKRRELIVCINLATGQMILAHQDELVIPLQAELSTQDMTYDEE